jgi:hypothetical protein
MVKLTANFQLVPGLRTPGAVPLITAPPPYVIVAWCLIKHRDTFMLIPFTLYSWRYRFRSWHGKIVLTLVFLVDSFNRVNSIIATCNWMPEVQWPSMDDCDDAVVKTVAPEISIMDRLSMITSDSYINKQYKSSKLTDLIGVSINFAYSCFGHYWPSSESIPNIVKELFYTFSFWRARASLVDWGTMLQAERSRVRFPITLFDFAIGLIFPAVL